jgi:AraC family transcriptional regulator
LRPPTNGASHSSRGSPVCRRFIRAAYFASGTSIYDYVLRERLAYALDAVLDRRKDITTIALDAGFTSHSHFTARFRRFFNCTPVAFRHLATAEHVVELRKIMTAQGSQLGLD